MGERGAAWDRLWEAMPARWMVSQPSYDPGARAWSISAVGPDRGRGKIPTSVTGRGEDAVGAIRDLDARLRGERIDLPRKPDELRVRLRLAWYVGAEEWSQRELGRRLTGTQTQAVAARFPDIGRR